MSLVSAEMSFGFITFAPPAMIADLKVLCVKIAQNKDKMWLNKFTVCRMNHWNLNGNQNANEEFCYFWNFGDRTNLFKLKSFKLSIFGCEK